MLAERVGAEPADALSAERVRRYLRWYGPSSPPELGAWAGVSPGHARRNRNLVAGELVEVSRRAGTRAWLLASDRATLAAAVPPRGVLLLAPGDPLLTGRDRDTLAPDERLRAALFRPAGSSGAVFVDGDLRGTWRARMSGGVLRIETDVARVRPQDAEDLARVRGARRVEVGAPMR